LRGIEKRGMGRVRRLVQRWGLAAEAAGLLAFSLASLGTGNASPSPSPPASASASAPTESYQVSFQANNNMLYGYTSNGSKPATTLGMQPGTSLASVQLSNGTFESAFQGKDHDLDLYKWNGTKISTTAGMAPGTSPALAGLPTGVGWVVAFQGRNHHLFIYTSYGNKIEPNPRDINLRMKPGTSPAIAAQPNDAWEVTFTGYDGKLNTYNSAGNGSWTSNAMDTASSPSMAALPDGSYQVAYEANNNSLAIYNTGGTTDHTGFSMDPGTSPSIASQPGGGWQVAFQAKDHKLDTANSAGNSHKTTDGMQVGTSPSVTPEPDGSYETAFEAKNDSLDVYHTDGTTDHTGFSMDPGTSPSAPITTPTLSAASASSPGSEIVSIAESQIGYQDTPTGSYCNPYTAHWDAGTSSSCGKGKSAEEWCADFASWVWRQAGVPFTYGYGSSDINAGAVSFYQWGVANGTWHAAGSGYTPQPGDVVVYGLNTPTDTTADHVAIVTGGTTKDPDVIDGDWWNSGNGSVAAATDQTTATGTDKISGYVSPWRPSSEEKRLPLKRKNKG
jgi:hypothetical protein